MATLSLLLAFASACVDDERESDAGTEPDLEQPLDAQVRGDLDAQMDEELDAQVDAQGDAEIDGSPAPLTGLSCDQLEASYAELRSASSECVQDDDCAVVGGGESCDCEPSIGDAEGDGIRKEAQEEAERYSAQYRERCEDRCTYDAPPVGASWPICVHGRCEVTQWFDECFFEPPTCAVGEGSSTACDRELCVNPEAFEQVFVETVSLTRVCDAGGTDCFAEASGSGFHLSFDASVLDDPTDQALLAGFRSLSAQWPASVETGEDISLSVAANDATMLGLEIDHGTFVATYSQSPVDASQAIESDEASCVTDGVVGQCACSYAFEALLRVAFRIAIR